MDEYISKQKVIDYLNGYLHSLGEGGADDLLFDRGQRRALINSIQDISAEKAADVQSVKHGRWIRTDKSMGVETVYACSECGYQVRESDITNYCGDCGSKLDKVTAIKVTGW